MIFRRNGLRDERRRRVLMDETLHGDAADASTESTGESVRNPAKSYSEAAIASSQLPVSALLPKRPFITWAVWLTGLLMIAGIEALYRYVFLPSTDSLRDSLTALDVTERGSLASWFGTVVLGVSAFGSMMIFQIRRHRTDDYRGRYRWWLWLVPLLLMLSVSAATGIHEVLSGLLTNLTGAKFAVGGKGWWLIAYAALFFPIVLQLLIELWPSRLATLVFSATVASYVCVGLMEIGAVQPVPLEMTTLFYSSLLLSAHLGVLITVLAYGRYVYLDAHERLAPRKKWMRWPGVPKIRLKRKAKKPKEPASVEKSSKSGKQVRVDEGHARFSIPNQSKSQTAAVDDDEDDDMEDENGRKLSRAERRRLRKESQRTERG